jgi:Sortase domain
MSKRAENKRAATTRQAPGRWLFVFPAMLMLAAGWFTVRPWQSSASSPVGKEFTEDLYSPERYRVLPDGMIEDTATGLRRKLESTHTGSTPSQADIRAFISLTDDQRADLRNGIGPRPVHLVVGAIGVDADVIPIGLDVNRALAVPRNAEITGWWSGGYVPGEIGPTVIVGHFDSKVASGVFAKLQTLRKGARITVEDSIGSKYVYEVVEMEHLRKTAFPTDKVYGATAGSTLRLVTCGGKFNRATGHYVDNTIAYAVLISAEVVGQVEPLRTVDEDFPFKIAPVFPVSSTDVSDMSDVSDLSDGVIPEFPVGDFPIVVPGSDVAAGQSTTTSLVGALSSTIPGSPVSIPPSTPSGVSASSSPVTGGGTGVLGGGVGGSSTVTLPVVGGTGSSTPSTTSPGNPSAGQSSAASAPTTTTMTPATTIPAVSAAVTVPLSAPATQPPSPAPSPDSGVNSGPNSSSPFIEPVPVAAPV